MGYGRAKDDSLDRTFAALSDATRRAILERLALGDATVNELAAPFNLTQPTISKHLKVLEQAHLIFCRRDAQRRPRSLVRKPLEDATSWLNGYRNPGTLQFSTPGENEIVMKRSFSAPRKLVFEAFVRPELLKRWFYGSLGGSLAVCQVARKPGDSFRYVWRNADGREIGMRGKCLDFMRPKRIVATEQFDVPWYPGEAVGKIELEERKGATQLTQTIQYESRAAREMALGAQIEHGVALGYERLEKLLESLQARKEATK
jgi:uncharacterized protein YndB with AHSA1/START domain/DNA-binding transcriptional ArsR family regulator